MARRSATEAARARRRSTGSVSIRLKRTTERSVSSMLTRAGSHTRPTRGAPAAVESRREVLMSDDDRPTVYDLILRGGRVVDPAEGHDGLLDVGVAGGRIAAVGPALPASATTTVVDVSGSIVTP